MLLAGCGEIQIQSDFRPLRDRVRCPGITGGENELTASKARDLLELEDKQKHGAKPEAVKENYA